jgi:hypothetical protein
MWCRLGLICDSNTDHAFPWNMDGLPAQFHGEPVAFHRYDFDP